MSFFIDDEDGLDMINIILVPMLAICLIALCVIGIYSFVDGVYIKPVADNNANEYCRKLGFDQYKEYSRIGLWSENPVGIKCEYAEKYSDLGVRSNIQD